MRKKILKFILAQSILIAFVFANFGTMIKEVCTFAEQISSNNEEITNSASILACGDFNSDGKINVFDLMRSKQNVLNKKEQPLGLADINLDGEFNILDSLILQDYILLRDTKFKNKINNSGSDNNPVTASDNNYRYVVFSEDKETPIQINSQLTTTNGKIATNSNFEGNRNINGDGKIIENANISMVYMDDKIVNTYFSNPEEYDEFIVENDDEANEIINTPTMSFDNILIEKSITLNSCMMAMNNIDIKSDTDNTGSTVIYSKYGDINIDCSNINVVGLIYAPFGTVKLSAKNVQIDGIIIAKNVIIDSEQQINLNANNAVAEFIGVDTEKMVIPYRDWNYIDKPDDAVLPEIVEEQIYEDPLSVDDEWLEDNYGSLIVDEYSAQMKKELVECLYIYMSEGISNLSDLIELFSFAAQGNAKDYIKLKTNLKNGKKAVSLTIGDYDISVEKEKSDKVIYGPMPYSPFIFRYYLTPNKTSDDSDNTDKPLEEQKKFKINDIGLFFKLAVAGVGTAAVSVATTAGGTIVSAGSAVAASAVNAVNATVTKITNKVEQNISKAVEKGKDSLNDIKNEVEAGIKDTLDGIADLDLFGIQYVPQADGFGFKIGDKLKFNVIKDGSTWTPQAIFNGEPININKIKNIVDLDTLNNINSISPQIYKDVVSSIMNDNDPEKILDIIDCINNNSDKYKIAYDKLNDIDKAYESVLQFQDRYNSYEKAKYSVSQGNKALKDNLSDNEVINPPYCFNSHHIVAKDAKDAKVARDILEKYNIDINSAANGVNLPGSGGKDYSYVLTESNHFGSHSKSYYDAVTEALKEADEIIIQNGYSNKIKKGETISKATKIICETLDELRKQLMNGELKL